MKLLFFSENKAEVKEVSNELKSAGIACEIRRHAKHRGGCCCGESEVWVQHDRDCHKALLLCVERGVGFARRPKSSGIDSWTDITSGTRFAADDDFPPDSGPHKLDRDIKSCSQAIRKVKAA
jgi:hypothetical protein